jgi:hypothetical protein
LGDRGLNSRMKGEQEHRCRGETGGGSGAPGFRHGRLDRSRSVGGGRRLFPHAWSVGGGGPTVHSKRCDFNRSIFTTSLNIQPIKVDSLIGTGPDFECITCIDLELPGLPCERSCPILTLYDTQTNGGRSPSTWQEVEDV